jgi:catechol 2,3-dioxygenase-like lactoylglutathione lyase family enzyme
MNEGMRLEGLTLTVDDVERSLQFYHGKLGLEVALRSLPAFALVKLGSGSIGLLSMEVALNEGIEVMSALQRRGIHIEFSTDDLDGLYETLKARGIEFVQPPHDEPWERSMTAYDPDGYSVEIAQGRRGKNQTSAN